MYKLRLNKNILINIIGLLCVLFYTNAQEYNTFDLRYQATLRGDLVLIGNNILNRDGGTSNTEPNNSYNNLSTDTDPDPETGGLNNSNLFKDMRYIDVDNDPTTFSSSEATFLFPPGTCNQIRYAGLYWSAIYPRDVTSDPVGTARQYPIDQIKIKVPGGSYIDVTADEIIYDGLTDPTLADRSPYACYADITSLVTGAANPSGVYTVANIPATQGVAVGNGLRGGAAAGWTLVLVYENPTLTGKMISTFDGFANVSSSNSIDIAYSGFATVPVGPVLASLGTAALEGDFHIPGDGLSLDGATLSNASNPADNFFNSNITLNGVDLAGRNPASLNTLGYDSDLFLLNNPANSVLGNSQTSATFTFSTTRDTYYPFFNSFNVEVIEPNIALEKTVEDIGGNDITGAGVNLGQVLDYVLTFQNTGNDDGTNYTIRDVLPANVDLDESAMILPPGVTYTYDNISGTIVFSIPDNLIEVNDTSFSIRIRVRVSNNCFDFIDACSGLIENIAYSSYQGVNNTTTITDDPSVTVIDNCGYSVPGTTNFLLDNLLTCDFTRTVQLCSDSLLLDAGDNFDTYTWYSDDNGNGLIDAGDTVLNDGDPDGDPSTLLVSETGVYIVDKDVAAPCTGSQEVIIVTLFGSVQSNPITALIQDTGNNINGEVLICPNDGDELPQVFLCGSNDTKSLQLNIPDAQSIDWELLDESSCASSLADCANKNNACTWNTLHTGGDFTVTAAGQYRVVINYQNGCFSRFYFNVFQNTLDVLYSNRDIICNIPGNITITNLGSNFGYQLVDITNNVIEVPFSAGAGPSFDITTNGAYRVDIIQLDATGNPIPNSCVFQTQEIGILNRDMQVDINSTQANCNTPAQINVQALNVFPNYSYELRLDDGTANGTLVDSETAHPNNNFIFNNVNPGNYIIVTRSDDGCEDIQNISVTAIPDPTLSALVDSNIGCTAGVVELTRTGGQGNPDFLFAIWSKDGVLLHSPGGSPTEQEVLNNIDPNAYQVGNSFQFGWRDTDGDGIDEYFAGEDGEYVFVVVDANNCYALSNPVTISDFGGLTIDSIDTVQPQCSGDANGQLTINISGGTGPYQFSIDNGATYQSNPIFPGLVAGNYDIRVLDSGGCDIVQPHILDQPVLLSASAGVSRDVTCNPSNGAEVRITNVLGGNAPYEYSFDGGATYGTSPIAILPPGNYTIYVRDASCTFPMTVTVDPLPTPPNVVVTPNTNYNCDGTGTITVMPSIGTYDYRYELNGVPNSPDPTNNLFTNVPPGTYTVTTYYTNQTLPSPSLLLNEDFGTGNGSVPSPDTFGYNYEDQTTSTAGGGDANTNIDDFEYSVTNRIITPFSTWVNPVDNTSLLSTGTPDPNGRFLVVNVGTASPGQIVYTKTINDVIPNRPLSISLYIFNLLNGLIGSTELDPDLTIEITDTLGNVIQSIRTGNIPKNTSDRDWVNFTTDFDPGTNTTLEFVIRSEISGNQGNDFALDDISIFQLPEVCELAIDTPVTIDTGRQFESSVISHTNASCNGLSDGTITFEVNSFNLPAGFEYSINGGPWILETSSPVTTGPVLNAANHTITIRKADETSCTISIDQVITEPAAVVAAATLTTALSCSTNATITASATGGLPGYTYQLEDNTGAIIGTFDFATNGSNTVFSGLGAGTYIVRAQDSNGCDDIIDTPIGIALPNPVAFDLVETSCYTSGNTASIAVNVTNGNGGYQFRINGGPWLTPNPVAATSYTFNNLSSGTFTIDVRDQLGCPPALATQSVTVEPELTLSANANNISACDTDTAILITANGGDTNYVYSVVPTGNVPSDTSFNTANPVVGIIPGTYDVYVRDNNGNVALGFCEALQTITITQDGPIDFLATTTDVLCNGDATGSISITVNSGGQSPFMYSIDGGTTYQTSNMFPNLSAGSYDVQVRDANSCESAVQSLQINEPTALSAFAAVASNIECHPNLGAEIQITNGNGGILPYEYSFDGGLSYSNSAIDFLPQGTHSLFIRDANLCTFEMSVVVAPPLNVPNVDTAIDYNCDGTGNLSLTPDNPGYDYTYALNGTPNTPIDSNIFTDIAPGTHAVTVNYISSTPTPPSIVFSEDFGTGPTTKIPEVDPRFCFEPLDGTTDGCNLGGVGVLSNGEYTVTQAIPNSALWRSPNDASLTPNGRFLAIDLGTVVGLDGIIYAKRGVSVIPNRELTITMDIFNLVRSTYFGSEVDPDVRIELLDSGGTVIDFTTTGDIPRNTNSDDWHNRQITLNPGNNSVIDIVLRTLKNTNNGNDMAIDNIIAFQTIEECTAISTFDIIIEDGNAFEAAITGSQNLDCEGDGSGSISIDAQNYGIGGYEYSVDGAPFQGPFTAPQTITGLDAGTRNIEVRDVNDPTSCTTTLTQILTQPNLLVVSATLTQDISCVNGGATITASANGGTPTYSYQLEDNTGGIITGYDFATNGNNNVFSGISVGGNYRVRVRDTNNCEGFTNTPVLVSDPATIVFDSTPTACYSGNNDGTITVNVTAGNGGYEFRLNGGPWIVPSPANASSHTFINLSNGAYTVEVRDQLGCPPVPNAQTLTINQELTATIAIVDISSCADGSITVNATGGDGNYAYAFMPTGNVPSFTDFSPANSYAVTAGNSGDYDVYVRDNLAVAPEACNYMETVTVNPAVPLVFNAFPAPPQCHDGIGSIQVNITAGTMPYTIELIDLDNGGAANRTDTNVLTVVQDYFNLAPGNYTITITDAHGCVNTVTPITITNPDELTADIVGVAPVDCNPDPNLYGFRFENYPTTIGTLEFSADGGLTWQSSDTFTGGAFFSGVEVEPAIRTISAGLQLCRTDFPTFTIPYPLDDLDISISAIIVDCNDLQVTVQGTEGLAPYEYTYSEDPTNFDPTTATWFPGSTTNSSGATVPAGHGNHVFTGLVPGRTYVFYVRDSSLCVRQSLQNVNDLAPPPIQIMADITPTCDIIAPTGQITYTVTENMPGELGGTFDWDFFRIDDVAPIGPPTLIASGTETGFTSGNSFTVPTPASLGPGEYFVEIRGAAPNNCRVGSENARIEVLDPILGTTFVIQGISCNDPGLVAIQSIFGGSGGYTFTLSSTNFITTIISNNNPVVIPLANLVDPTISPFNINVEVADQYGCTNTLAPVSMTVAQNPTITSVVTNNCATPFSITVNASGGSGSYLYSLDGGTTYLNNGGVFNNVAASTYAISVIDTNGCTVTDTADIYPLLQASALNTKLLDCTVAPSSSDAVITIEAFSGSGSYDYEITGPINQVRTGLTSPEDWTTSIAGTYTVNVYDNNRPTCPPRTFTVDVPARVDPQIQIDGSSDVTCNGFADGTITVSSIGNALAPYSFEITSIDGTLVSIAPTSATATTATFTGLAPTTTAAAYIVTITGDATTNNCTANSTPISIGEPAPIGVAMDTPVEFSCTTGNLVNNASLRVNSVVGGSGNYVRYQFFDSANLTTPLQDGSSDTYIETNAAGRNYTIVVFDDQGCSGSTTASIAPLDELLPATVTVDDPITCLLGENITINAFGSLTDSSTPGGLTNYNFRQLPGGTFGSSNVFTNLSSGIHNFEVMNIITGCVVTVSHMVRSPNNLVVTATATNELCFGDNGSVTFAINDPINPYSGGFSWQIYNSQGTLDLADDTIVTGANGTSATVGPTAPFSIIPGNYRVEVLQNSNPNCTASAFFTISGPSADIMATPVITPISCVPGNDGIINLTNVQGGWGGYLYYVDTVPISDEFDSANYTNDPTFENLGPGTYQIWVIDQNGCPAQLANQTLNVPTPIVADLQINNSNCTDFSGELEVVGIPAVNPVSGGQGSNYTYELFRGAISLGSQTSTVFTGLGAGSYTVQITDQLGCTLTVGPQVLFDVIAPAATITKAIDCNSGGTITLTQAGGSGTFGYEVRYPGTLPTDPADDTNTTGVFVALNLVGDYVFTITDQAIGHMCSTTITQRLEDRVEPEIQIDGFTNVSCSGLNDGTMSVSANPDNGIGPYTFSIISGPGSGATFPIAPTTATDATAVFSGLEGSVAGITYTVRITSPNGCFDDLTQLITEPNILSNVSAHVTQFGCAVGNTNNNARISVDVTSITGGSGNYVRFEFIDTATGLPVQDGSNPTYVTNNFSGGNYDVFVYDDQGCSNAVAINETIAPFAMISDPIVTDLAAISCNPGNDAQIQVNVTVTPVSATPNLEYTVTRINNPGVPPLPPLTFTNNTGLFTNLPAANYSVTITNLDADPDCIVETVHTIDEPEIMQVIATKLSDEDCLNNSVDDGSFELTSIANYTGNYDYQVFDGSGSPIMGLAGSGNTATPLSPFTNLVTGSYLIEITQTEAPFCVAQSNSISIQMPNAPISAIILEQAGVGCSNDQGQLLISAQGGYGPYTIVANNTTTGQNYTASNSLGTVFTSLSAGNYDITVIDSRNCDFTDTISLIRPDDIVATLTPSTLVCFGDNDASVTTSITVSRNVPAIYQYELLVYADNNAASAPIQVSARQSSATFDNLGAGFYSVRVTDDNGCSTETNRVIISDPSEVQAQLVLITPLGCTTNAELELRAMGGSGPYEYSSDGFNFFAMNQNNGPGTHGIMVGPGVYSYYVRDNNGCISIASNEITENPIEPLMLIVDTSAANINCTGENTAIIFADAQGGVGDYLYELYTDPNLTPASRIAGPQSLGEFRDLPLGDYYVNVTSGNGNCNTNAMHVPITEPAPLTYTESVLHPSCAGEENGSITIALTGGVGGYQYAISPNLDQFDTANTFENLAAGDYTIIAQDQNGCFEVLEYTLIAPSPLLVNITNKIDEVCVGSADGSFELDITGGVAPYSTSLNSSSPGSFVQDQVLFQNLAAGTYVVFVVDAQGCETNIIVEIDPGVDLNASVTPIYECDGLVPNNRLEITLEDDSVLNEVLYNIDSTNLSTMQLTPDFSNLSPGNHTLVIAHSNGCMNIIDFEIASFDPLTLTLEQNNINEITAVATGGSGDYTFYFDEMDNGSDNTYFINRTDTFTVMVVDSNGCTMSADISMEFIDIEIPKFFTPDGDGVNDTWAPYNLEAYPNVITIVFDRYGRELYRMNRDTIPWEGIYQNYDLPSGDYWYVIKLNGVRDQREFIGYFTLYR